MLCSSRIISEMQPDIHTMEKFAFLKSIIHSQIIKLSVYHGFFLDSVHGSSMFAVKAKNYGVICNQSRSIAFDETCSYWSVSKSF